MLQYNSYRFKKAKLKTLFELANGKNVDIAAAQISALTVSNAHDYFQMQICLKRAKKEKRKKKIRTATSSIIIPWLPHSSFQV